MQRALFALICAAIIAILTPHQTFAASRPEQPLLTPGTPAPDFSAIGMDGKPLRLSDYRGKIVVLDFWASWCPPCNEEMPGIEDLYLKYKSQGVVVLGLNIWDDADPAFQWIQAHPQYNFTFAHDPAGYASRYPSSTSPPSLGDPFRVWGVPTTYIIDPGGNVYFDGVVASETDLATALNSEIQAINTPPTINDGEILLTGTVSVASSGKSTFQIAATSVTSSDDETTTFDTARPKTVTTSFQTAITDLGAPIQVSALTVGTHLYVVGTDGGKGKAIVARAIVVPQQN